MNELVEVLTEDGKTKGKQISKDVAHKDGICHGICAVALIDSKGRVLIQKRSKTKRDEANKWDLSSAGHIEVDETPKETAIRETYEEIGIKINENELVLIDTYLNKAKLDSDLFINHFTYLFLVQKDIGINDIKIRKQEVSEIMFVDKNKLNELYKNGQMVYAIKYCIDNLNKYLGSEYMTIGIDIDGVLTNLEEWQYNTGKEFTSKPIQNPEAFDVKGIFDLTDDEYKEFLDLYLTDYSKNYPARENASTVIKKLREEGNKIVIVTGRFHTTEDTLEGEKQRNIVYNWLKKYDIEYDNLIFTGPHDNKLDILKNNDIRLMIEDKASTIETLSEHMPVICFDAIYNRNCAGDNIYRVSSWNDIYSCVKDISKHK